MINLLKNLLDRSAQVKGETTDLANTATRVGQILIDLAKLGTSRYDSTASYDAGQYAIDSGVLVEAVTAVDPGQSPTAHPDKWSRKLVIDPLQVVAGNQFPVAASVVKTLIDQVQANGGVPNATTSQRGAARQATDDEAAQGINNDAFITPMHLQNRFQSFYDSYADAALDKFAEDTTGPVLKSFLGSLLTASQGDLSIGQALCALITLAECGKTLVSITVSGADTVNKTAQAQYKAMGVYSNGTTEDITAQATWSVTKPNEALETFTTPGLLDVPDNGISGDTHNDTITATLSGKTGTLVVTIADGPPTKLLEFFVARNADTGSLSVYASGQGILKTILTATGSTPAYSPSVKTMTTDPGGYQRPDLFTGSKAYAGLYPAVPNGTYLITLLAEDGQQISYNIPVTDSGPVQVLRQITSIAYTVGQVYYLRPVEVTQVSLVITGPDSYNEGSGAQYGLARLMSDDSTQPYTDPYNMGIVSPPSGTSMNSTHYASTNANTISADTEITIQATTGSSGNFDQTYQSENASGSGQTYPNDSGGLKKEGTILYSISGFPGVSAATVTLRYSSNQTVPTASILVNGVAISAPTMLAKDGGYDTITFIANLTGNNDTIQIGPASGFFSQDFIRVVATVNNVTVLASKVVTINNIASTGPKIAKITREYNSSQGIVHKIYGNLFGSSADYKVQERHYPAYSGGPNTFSGWQTVYLYDTDSDGTYAYVYGHYGVPGTATQTEFRLVDNVGNVVASQAVLHFDYMEQYADVPVSTIYTA